MDILKITIDDPAESGNISLVNVMQKFKRNDTVNNSIKSIEEILLTRNAFRIFSNKKLKFLSNDPPRFP
jgi:hypothetical protein